MISISLGARLSTHTSVRKVFLKSGREARQRPVSFLGTSRDSARKRRSLSACSFLSGMLSCTHTYTQTHHSRLASPESTQSLF